MAKSGHTVGVPVATYLFTHPWSSLEEGDECLYLRNSQTNLVIALFTLSLLFCKFINTTAYTWADMSLHLP